MTIFRIEHYVSTSGKDVFGDWFDRLRDPSTQQRIATRIERLALGLLGDAKLLRAGVYEIRIDTGPGYRVYFAFSRRTFIVLLCAGSKGTQRKDITRAIEYWSDFQGRHR
jgi:putative addiction module killer protein